MDNGASSYRRFLDGDDSAMVEIIRAYKDGLLLYINGLVKNISVAEELMEDTFFKIMVKKPRFAQKHSFKTWLYTVGRNTAIDYLRRSSKIADISPESCPSLLVEEESLETAYIRREQRILVHRTLKS